MDSDSQIVDKKVPYAALRKVSFCLRSEGVILNRPFFLYFFLCYAYPIYGCPFSQPIQCHLCVPQLSGNYMLLISLYRRYWNENLKKRNDTIKRVE